MKRLACAVPLCLFLAAIATAQDRPPRAIPEGAEPRERFLKLIDRARVPLKPTIVPGLSGDGIEEIEFASEAGQRVPGLLLKPKGSTGRQPVVIVLHGTGGSKDGQRPLLKKLADRGLIAVAIDGRYAGHRVPANQAGAAAYRTAIFEAWKTGKGYPFLYDTVWDVLRLIDYLETRNDVDPKRIGAIGFSKGGMELYLAAAVDPRLAAVVPCIGVQSFNWALEHNLWQSRISTIQSAVDQAAREAGSTVDSAFIQRFYERVVPGVHREFDGPAMLPLIAPRPLLVINGDKDDRTPQPGLQLCIDAARAAYEKAGAAQQFEFILQPDTGHTVTPQSEKRAIDWLVEHLK